MNKLSFKTSSQSENNQPLGFSPRQPPSLSHSHYSRTQLSSGRWSTDPLPNAGEEEVPSGYDSQPLQFQEFPRSSKPLSPSTFSPRAQSMLRRDQHSPQHFFENQCKYSNEENDSRMANLRRDSATCASSEDTFKGMQTYSSCPGPRPDNELKSQERKELQEYATNALLEEEANSERDDDSLSSFETEPVCMMVVASSEQDKTASPETKQRKKMERLARNALDQMSDFSILDTKYGLKEVNAELKANPSFKSPGPSTDTPPLHGASVKTERRVVSQTRKKPKTKIGGWMQIASESISPWVEEEKLTPDPLMLFATDMKPPRPIKSRKNLVFKDERKPSIKPAPHRSKTTVMGEVLSTQPTEQEVKQPEQMLSDRGVSVKNINQQIPEKIKREFPSPYMVPNSANFVLLTQESQSQASPSRSEAERKLPFRTGLHQSKLRPGSASHIKGPVNPRQQYPITTNNLLPPDRVQRLLAGCSKELDPIVERNITNNLAQWSTDDRSQIFAVPQAMYPTNSTVSLQKTGLSSLLPPAGPLAVGQSLYSQLSPKGGSSGSMALLPKPNKDGGAPIGLSIMGSQIGKPSVSGTPKSSREPRRVNSSVGAMRVNLARAQKRGEYLKGRGQFMRYRSSQRTSANESFMKNLNIEPVLSGAKNKNGAQLEYLKKLIISNSEESVDKRNLLSSERRNTDVRVQVEPVHLSSIQENDSNIANQQEGSGMEITGIKKHKHTSLFKPCSQKREAPLEETKTKLIMPSKPPIRFLQNSSKRSLSQSNSKRILSSGSLNSLTGPQPAAASKKRIDSSVNSSSPMIDQGNGSVNSSLIQSGRIKNIIESKFDKKHTQLLVAMNKSLRERIEGGYI